MSTYQNHTCKICGTPYHACQSCDNIHSFQPWRTITDTRACYKIFLILNSYTNGYASPLEAREQLLGCDLTSLDSFVPKIRDTIQNILSEPN